MAEEVISHLRDFPAVEELLQTTRLQPAIAALPRPIAAGVVKRLVAEAKAALKSSNKTLTRSELIERIHLSLTREKRREVSRVVNATGIIVHTNLGRAPLSESIFTEIMKTVVGYGNIEFDMDRGIRGKRGTACEKYLAMLSGAEAGTVVNNCAAALFVSLNTLANRKKVLISRGELVQIGGGFRIPDILKRSGAKLCEVGTTNITSVADYESSIDDRTALILKVHKSNFVQAGFTEEAPLKDLVALGKRHGIPVLNDLGSGVFFPTRKLLGYAEPTVQQSVAAGATVTTFSGDKMLGGSQAGLIVGSADYIAKIKKNPIFRTIRADKIVFSILERLLTIYLNGTHETDIKVWALLSVPVSELYKRGKEILKELNNPPGISVEATQVYIGGGALPQSEIPSVGIVFSSSYKANTLMKRFRALEPPIIGRIEDDRFILDLKAVDVDDIDLITRGIQTIIE